MDRLDKLIMDTEVAIEEMQDGKDKEYLKGVRTYLYIANSTYNVTK